MPQHLQLFKGFVFVHRCQGKSLSPDDHGRHFIFVNLISMCHIANFASIRTAFPPVLALKALDLAGHLIHRRVDSGIDVVCPFFRAEDKSFAADGYLGNKTISGIARSFGVPQIYPTFTDLTEEFVQLSDFFGCVFLDPVGQIKVFCVNIHM